MLVATVTLSLFSAPAARAEYDFITKWKGAYLPEAVATDPAGNVFVGGSAQEFSNAVHMFTSDGTLITTWGIRGTGDGELGLAQGIAIGPSGSVYVAEVFSDRIQKFTPDGTFVTKWGSKGRGEGQFDEPEGVATDSAEYVYVADTENHRIQKFTPDGTFVTQWGSEGRGAGQFDLPVGVATDSAGSVYVADAFNDRIQKFTSDGTFVTAWRARNPSAIATDAVGSVYLLGVPGEEIKIRKFSSDGALLAKWGCSGRGDGRFDGFGGIATDGAGNVYVADPETGWIQKFGDPGLPTRPCLDLDVDRLQKLKGLALEVACGNQPCAVTVEGFAIARHLGTSVASATAKTQRFQLKPARTSLARNQAKRLRLDFPRPDARTLTRLLKQGARAKVKVTATARTVGGGTSTDAVRIKLEERGG